MNAPIAKDHFGYSLGNLSYIGPEYEEAEAPAVKSAGRGLSARLSGLVARFAEWQQRRQVMEEMALMSDRELSDIGLSRSDLPRVFDHSFAADHARGRDYIAY
jgi:uncharacterized protein YjiS (DUF1127 family)